MAILRSFISDLNQICRARTACRSYTAPATFFERRRYFEECQPARNMGRHLRDCSIPYSKQRGLETGHPPAKRARFGTARLAESRVPAYTDDLRSATLSVSRIHGND